MYAPALLQHAGKYYGKYAGIVTKNDQDTAKKGHVVVKVPTVFGDQVEMEARPCFPFGHFWVPAVGTKVWVEFEAGDPQYAIWVGVWYADGEVPAKAALAPPDNRVMHTPSGHMIEVTDKKDEEKIVIRHMKNSFLSVDKEGSIVVSNQKGSFLNLDSKNQSTTLMEQHGNLITMSSDGVLIVNDKGVSVEIKGDNVRILAAGNIQLSGKKILIQGQTVGIGENAMEPTLLGQTFLISYAAHTHATAVGPSGPPVPPAIPMQVLTQVTKVK
jgi:hypothetical protein